MNTENRRNVRVAALGKWHLRVYRSAVCQRGSLQWDVRVGNPGRRFSVFARRVA